MNKKIINLLKLPDEIFSKKLLKHNEEKKSLITVLFHGIFKDEKEIKLNHIDPQLGVKLNNFNQFIDYFKDYDYDFVSPNNILKGLNPEKNHIMITFDDGYYNNIKVLPTLEENSIPAVFFISTDHIKNNKSYWWDVHYRENLKLGKKINQILNEQKNYKNMKNEEIENILTKNFGKKAFTPKSDIDRPFNPDELKDFSKEKFVFLGNHTKNHAILTNYSSQQIEKQIINAQNDLKNMTNITTNSISYPNGNFSDKVINISNKLGLKIGVTLVFKKNYLPLETKNNSLLKLGRFEIVEGYDITKQCMLFRSDIVFYRKIVNILNSGY